MAVVIWLSRLIGKQKKEKREIYQLIASPQFLFHFLHVLYSKRHILFESKYILKKGPWITWSFKWMALSRILIDVAHQYSMYCNCKTQIHMLIKLHGTITV